MLGFTQDSVSVGEDSDIIGACIEVCEGILKRDVEIDVEVQNSTAICE